LVAVLAEIESEGNGFLPDLPELVAVLEVGVVAL